MDNNNYNNDDNTSQSPVVDALRRHFHSLTKEPVFNNKDSSTDSEAERKVITVRPLGFRNARF